MDMRYEGQRYEMASRCYLIVPPVCAGPQAHPRVAWSDEDGPVGLVRRDGVSEVFHAHHKVEAPRSRKAVSAVRVIKLSNDLYASESAALWNEYS